MIEITFNWIIYIFFLLRHSVIFTANVGNLGFFHLKIAKITNVHLQFYRNTKKKIR